jgi:arylformamidase
MAVWPGDTPFNLRPVMSLAAGETVNLTALDMSAHTGTHVDSVHHFYTGGRTMEEMDLGLYWGMAQVVTVQKAAGPLYAEDFSDHELGQAPRLLVHSPASHESPTIFPEGYIYPSPGLAKFLSEKGIILYGTDAPSMDAVDSKTLDGHNALRRHDIAILEALDLSSVQDGLYEMVALPLKIIGGDGSPVRAALRTLD